jgi:shikimate kinase
MPSPLTKPLFLVGFMGTGKSTVGTLLAARWGWPFVDLDERIEQQTGSTIAELFANVGEAGFRAEEARALKLVAAERLQVVAVGGGAVIHKGNLPLMLSVGVVVCLRATPDTILARVGDAATRPLLSQAQDRRAEIERLLQARAGYYQQAHHTVDTDGIAPSHVANQIEAELCR